jgi:hypothetical protein
MVTRRCLLQHCRLRSRLQATMPTVVSVAAGVVQLMSCSCVTSWRCVCAENAPTVFDGFKFPAKAEVRAAGEPARAVLLRSVAVCDIFGLVMSQAPEGGYKRKDRELDRAGLHLLRCEGQLGEGTRRRKPAQHPSYSRAGAGADGACSSLNRRGRVCLCILCAVSRAVLVLRACGSCQT